VSNEIKINEVQKTSYEVDGKLYKTEEAANAALEALANVEQGVAFAASQFPELAPRAQRTKANLIGAYLDWLDAGELEVPEAEREHRIAKADAKRAKLESQD